MQIFEIKQNLFSLENTPSKTVLEKNSLISSSEASAKWCLLVIIFYLDLSDL